MLPTININKTHIYIALAAISLLAVFYFSQNRPLAKAKKHVGQLEATTGSYEVGFQSKKFENKMYKYGFREGYDWCAIFAKSVVMDSISARKKAIINQLMNPSSQQTYNNLLRASTQYNFIKISEKPIKGAIVIWQKVTAPAFGHVGIVAKVKGSNFSTIEGNVSTGTGYDGVAVKQHNTNEKFKNSGLRLHNYFIKIN